MNEMTVQYTSVQDDLQCYFFNDKRQ